MIEKGRQMDFIDQINSLLFTTGDASKIQNDDELQSWGKNSWVLLWKMGE